MNTILILTDLQTRKAFDIYSICQRLGYTIVGTSEGSTFERSVLSIIYTKILKPLNSESFITDLDHQLNDLTTKAVFFPTEEKTILSFYNYLENTNNSKVYYNLPSRKVFDLVRDKGKFSKFCIDSELPVPMEYDYETLILQDEIPCNLIIKPKIGSGSMGIRFIDNILELRECADLAVTKPQDQEMIEKKIGFFANFLGGFKRMIG
jgi:hypothetical protein